MNIDKLKTLGNKIYTNANKIKEAERSGMRTRIPGYIAIIEQTQKELDVEIKKVKDEYN